ncbi:IniB N-terminal domain-containing protein [Microbacterium ureisolvens]|uniref:IniB N-terminal domain-containing protein n=1 Tax=Microbacterium ureisolvens TaxID=2781186 RepID=A0ABS7I2U9_9MICO|nr:IniB N-terminal domain-containing protein [Microbacterium ureisolvens]MBW9111997.1 IniB N-terminal domain-containing protein [Microbacterium ureisolvens]
MTTPLATIADALIEFILSLLGDPAAAAEFEEDPEGTLARNGLSDACVEDVRAVAPVIVDHPHVTPKPPMPPAPPKPPSVENEIYNITNAFAIDNRATIVDQSVNQNIWADGDVTQIFDQEAVVNSGDNGAAAGDDAEVDNSEDTTTVGDVSIGNEDTTTNIDGSFNDNSTNTDTEVDAEADESFNNSPGAAPVVSVETAAAEAPPVEAPPVEAVAPPVEIETVAEDAYDYAADAATFVDEEPPLEPETEDQY